VLYSESVGIAFGKCYVLMSVASSAVVVPVVITPGQYGYYSLVGLVRIRREV
jgi:hypothetical protein